MMLSLPVLCQSYDEIFGRPGPKDALVPAVTPSSSILQKLPQVRFTGTHPLAFSFVSKLSILSVSMLLVYGAEGGSVCTVYLHLSVVIRKNTRRNPAAFHLFDATLSILL